MRNYFKISYKHLLEGKREEFVFFDDHDETDTVRAFNVAKTLREEMQTGLLATVELRVSVKRGHAQIRGVNEIGQFINLPPETEDAPLLKAV
jgi:hypothetical protein